MFSGKGLMASFSVCPACGADTLKSDSAKSVVCATCGFVYFFNPAAAVAAIIVNAKNELLVAIRASDPGKGQWDLPGGFVDPGESAEEAIRREVKEELNLDIESMTYFCSVPNEYAYKQVTYATVDLAFICQVNDFSGIQALDDVANIMFVPIDTIDLEKFAFDSIRTTLSRYADHIGL